MLPEPVKIGCVTLYNCDCVELLKEVSDGQYDLAICDPPYGLSGKWKYSEKAPWQPFKQHEIEEANRWDIAPSSEYFAELKRVSKNQIIWGANYYIEHLGSCRGPIIWNKGTNGFSLADGEFAYSSYDKPLRICSCGQSIRSADKKNTDGRWHLAQKPVYLYKWILERYPKKGDKILDTHLGSGTHAMACLELGFELTACEISEKYFNEAVERIKNYLSSHEKIFDSPQPKLKLSEEGIF
jgi:site-specific DNA-methyltransferase (adenine-specific)